MGISGSTLNGSSGGGGGGAATIADGADVTEGAIADVAVTGDNSGTVSAKLRGLNKILADVWDSVNHWLKVSLQASSAVIGHVIVDKVALTPASPTAATVGTSSAQALASNSSRKGLILVNTSNNVIYLGFGAAAVVGSGVVLTSYGSFTMQPTTMFTGAVNAIASAVSSNLAIQEFS